MKRRTKYLLWGLLALWLVAAVGLVQWWPVVNSQAGAAHEVFQGFGDSLVAKQYARAYGYCGRDFHQAISLEQFVRLNEGLESKYGSLRAVSQATLHTKYTLKPERWTTEIDANFDYEKTRVPFAFALWQENGQWVVYGYEQR